MGFAFRSVSSRVGQPGWGYPNDWLKRKPILKGDGLFVFRFTPYASRLTVRKGGMAFKS